MPTPTPAAASPVEKTLLSTRVYARLRCDIISGRLAPGERLVELRLAGELHVSQGTVREAIKRLAAEGLVLSVPHRSSLVATADAIEARRAYRIRVALERVCVDDFCANSTAAELETLTAHIEGMRAAALAGDLDAVVRHDASFHRLVWERSGDPLLGRIWDLIEPSMRGLTRLSNRLYFADMAEIADSHQPLLEALQTRDASQAADLFVGHAQSVWHMIDADALALGEGQG